MIRDFRIKRGFVLAALWACCCAGDFPKAHPPAADPVLADRRTQAQISEFAGKSPSGCVEAAPSQLLCSWFLTTSDPGWRLVGEAVGTSDRVNLICVLPADGTPRSNGSCAAYPRRSDRATFYLPPESDQWMEAQRQAAVDKLRKAARSRVTGISDLEAAVALTGTLPSDCFDEAEGRTCIWHLNNRTLGHGTVAASVGARMSKRMVLTCPLDAEGRVRERCEARIDD